MHSRDRGVANVKICRYVQQPSGLVMKLSPVPREKKINVFQAVCCLAPASGAAALLRQASSATRKQPRLRQTSSAATQATTAAQRQKCKKARQLIPSTTQCSAGNNGKADERPADKQSAAPKATTCKFSRCLLQLLLGVPARATKSLLLQRGGATLR